MPRGCKISARIIAVAIWTEQQYNKILDLNQNIITACLLFDVAEL